MSDKYLTTAELAARLRTSPETVRYWRYTSYGPRGVKVGRRVLYSSAEVDRWLGSLRSPKRDGIPSA
jgi:predicted DNA-binding transcriptional regulator AlpA